MSDLPTKDAILDWLRANPRASGKRDIARAFNIKGAARIDLKRILREMQDDGLISKRQKRMRPPGELPPVTLLTALAPDEDGDVFAEPVEWEEEAEPPRILFMPKKGDPGLGPGDRFLARLRPVEGEFALNYEARLIKKLGQSAPRILGIFREGRDGDRIVPVSKKADREWLVPRGASEGARDGELVEAEKIAGPRMGLPRAKVTERLGDPGAPRQVSLIAIHEHEIPDTFPDKAIAEAEAAEPVALGEREDLRGLPLLTIDPPDARDHDDAVAAAPDDDPANPGGHVVWVAIADVAHYVRPGTALDKEAKKRGNSTYFPDRVSPMLPEALSADLCSLHEGVDRPCLAIRMVLDSGGNKIGHRVTRGMMRSAASLSYAQAQDIEDGRLELDPGLNRAIRNLFAAYRAADEARKQRQPLDLDLPERRVEIDDEGEVARIQLRERFDAHRLIEEFMILANVAAAETLEAQRRPCLYRVHEEPNDEKMDALRETVEALGMKLAKGQAVRTSQLNQLLRAARDTDAAELVNMQVLRSQTQAYYAPENIGHFGLNLARYAHFTSPIRRYADLIVHRALMKELTEDEIDSLGSIAEHISTTERRSMDAERDTVDRYVAHYLSGRVGAEFPGRISGVAKFGLFVKLDETGADGLIPISTLGREYFQFDAEALTLRGERSGTVLSVGMRAVVRLAEASPVTGGLIFDLISAEGGERMGSRGRSRAPKKKLGNSRLARTKARRKARRG
ncbi:ribonuclease R [Rhodobacteraceae bacterium NNCM2]|nr:ribonuclease R [Coraliihabitans acroporae]